MDFERLVDDYSAPLFRFALSLTRAEGEAGDLVQQTFYIWAAKGHQLQEEAKVKTWLFTTLYREFLGQRRKRNRFQHEPFETAGERLPPIEPRLAEALDSQSAVSALGRLDERFQGPVALFYLEDCPYNEIAGILQIPVGTVKSRIARGLAQLRSVMVEAADSPSSPKDAT